MAVDKEILQRAVDDEKSLQAALWVVDGCIGSADGSDNPADLEWSMLNDTVQKAWAVRKQLIEFLDSIKRANEVVFGEEEIFWEREKQL